jgi:phosphoribosyl-dephospho-CoA transferase
MSDSKPLGENVALLIVHDRLNELKAQQQKHEDQNLKIFQQLTDNQKSMSERLVVVETNNEHMSSAMIQLKKDSSLQTKILFAILTAIITAVMKKAFGF